MGAPCEVTEQQLRDVIETLDLMRGVYGMFRGMRI
jgi:hypothetical protein